MTDIVLQKIDHDYPYDLLLQADETREGIDQYLFDSEVYVARIAGRDKPVGVMCLLSIDGDTVELMNIAVDEPFRGRGIGGEMIERAVGIAAGKGYREIILGTGTEDCAPAQIRFYERHGFVKSHLRENYFLDKYPDEPIYDNGVQLKHMQVLKRELATVYKYLDTKGAMAMLRKGTIRFTQARRLNDPFDCHPALVEHFSWGNAYRAAQFSYSEAYICSLSKIKDSILMWAYYTNNHKGVCIGLDIKKVEGELSKVLKFSFWQFGPFYDVSYQNIVNKSNCIGNGANRVETYKYISSVKAKCWEHEKEVRMLCSVFRLKETGSSNKDHYDPCIDGACFVSVYLGAKTSIWHEKRIINLAKKLNPNIKIYKMGIDPDAFKLNYNEIVF